MGLLSLAIWTPIDIGLILLALGRDEQAPMVRWVASSWVQGVVGFFCFMCHLLASMASLRILQPKGCRFAPFASNSTGCRHGQYANAKATKRLTSYEN
jgi:hypothetical protein